MREEHKENKDHQVDLAHQVPEGVMDHLDQMGQEANQVHLDQVANLAHKDLKESEVNKDPKGL